MSRARRAPFNLNVRHCYSFGFLFFASRFILTNGSGYVEPRNSLPGLEPWDSTFWWYFYNITNNETINSSNGASSEISSSSSSSSSSSLSSTTILLATSPEATITPTNSTNFSLIETSTPPFYVQKKPFGDKHKPKLMRSECQVYEDYQLYDMLAEKGAYNQRFMANSPEEIAHRMVHDFKLVKDNEEDINSNENNEYHHINEPLRHKRGSTDELPCGWQCRKIKLILKKYSEGNSSLKSKKILKSLQLISDAENEDEVNANFSNNAQHSFRNWEKSVHSHNSFISEVSSDASNNQVTTTSCEPEHFIAIGDCETRGTEVVQGYDRLCTECRGVYRMPPGCFPQFLNAVKCNDTDVSCIHDGWSNVAHGQCKAKSLTFTMMRNVGTSECQNWRFESVQVPIACECFLNKSSWLRA